MIHPFPLLLASLLLPLARTTVQAPRSTGGEFLEPVTAPSPGRAPVQELAPELASLVQRRSLYDVSDLVLEGSVPPGPSETAPSGDGGAPAAARARAVREWAGEERLARWRERIDALARSLQAHCPVADLTVRAVGLDRLEVLATDEGQRWTADFLEAQRRAAGVVHRIEVRLLDLPAGSLVRLPQEPAASRVLADRAALEEFVHALTGLGARLLSAPSVATESRQEASLSNLNQISYVRSYSLEIVEPGGRAIADPEVATLDEGVTIVLEVTPLPGDRTGLSLDVGLLHVERPIRSRQVQLSPALPPVEIGIPEITEVNVGGRVELDEDSALALFASTPDGRRELVVLVRVERLTAPPADGALAPAAAGGEGQGGR